MKNTTRLFLLVLGLLISVQLYAGSDMDIRIHHESIDMEKAKLRVSIQIRVHERLNVGGQNYRIYYPTSALTLNTLNSESALDKNVYSDLIFAQIFENAQAKGIGNIPFENDLGLASMFIELEDIFNGGLELNPGHQWVTLASLSFDIIGEFDQLEMIIARPEISKEYATAFTEFTSWNGPYKMDRIGIYDYQDYYYKIEKEVQPLHVTSTIGPNPTRDHVAIQLSEAIPVEVEVVLYDQLGRVVHIDSIEPNEMYHILDVQDLHSQTYFLALYFPKEMRTRIIEPLIVAK